MCWSTIKTDSKLYLYTPLFVFLVTIPTVAILYWKIITCIGMVAATRPNGQLNPIKEYELTATMTIGVETTGVETTGVETNILRWNQVSICSVFFC